MGLGGVEQGGGLAYLPFVLVNEVLIAAAAPEVEDRAVNFLTVFMLRGTLLDECAEGRNARAGSYHDDGNFRVERESELAWLDVYLHSSAFIPIPGTGCLVCGGGYAGSLSV